MSVSFILVMFVLPAAIILFAIWLASGMDKEGRRDG